VRTVADCSSLDEAMLLRSLLEDSGIHATVPEELTVTYLGQTGGFRLQVNDEDAETAAGIIAQAGK
jgi:hypothetical protein